jgi:Ca-activated chloride channel family protein
LLTEIRLHGEDPELVQSVVNLSIRYGIITPYTSYLIEEDDIFTQTGRQEIVTEVVEDLAAAPALVTGADAVEEAAAAGEMAEAEAPLAFATSVARMAGDEGMTAVSETVRLVGSKTFVWRDGAWVDTAYDPETFTLNPINFASDGYFELLTAVPELAQYFALGQHVLVVHEDTAYEIMESGVENIPTIEVDNPATTPTAVTSSGNATPSNLIASSTRVPTTAVAESSSSISGWGVFWGILLALLILGVGIQIGRGHKA